MSAKPVTHKDTARWTPLATGVRGVSACKWDREREAYIVDGEPCKRDAYGDPTRHCTARRTCSEHVGYGELTCARCMGRTRTDIRVIRDRSVELLPEAIDLGRTDSEAALLAGPGCPDLVAWTDRQRAMKTYLDTMERTGRITEKQLIRARENMDDEDEQHPYTVLTRWQMMLSEDYGHPLPNVMSISGAAAYLERTLPRIAHDDEQDFPLFAREIRKCRTHLENVLRDSQTPERGAPCTRCTSPAPRLTREYAHWCDDPDCERIHYSTLTDGLTGEPIPDTDGDMWVCPRNSDHAWTEHDYRRWVADVYEEARRA